MTQDALYSDRGWLTSASSGPAATLTLQGAHMSQLSHPGIQPARALMRSSASLIPALGTGLQSPCLSPCLQQMKQLMAGERKRAPHHRHPDNTGAGIFFQDVALHSCHDSGRDGCFTSQAGPPNNKVTNELARLRTVVWAQA